MFLEGLLRAVGRVCARQRRAACIEPGVAVNKRCAWAAVFFPCL